ncbi:helix-turn-helix transcriptional regulator [Roseicyclus sp. F158]|uniref:Helix-turn-helix transcriptional regulator n=1 Tax=Tropicimonas omnivorans TaxID=3075590 RepID=A0ABU3DHQ2_9RHOB|nr:helix-turn-helix transcriptional regulator [Roseicyclus sp. F158]MDT0683069.1 helix-turn-helix transcriptional regulator [Roseicyclus sp. F158]
MTDQLTTADTPQEVWSSAMRLLPDLGLSKVVFLDLSRRGSPLILSNAEETWTDDYADAVVSGRDPFPINCLSRIAPVLTGIAHLEAHPALTDGARDEVARGSASLDIRTGMSVTICPGSLGAGVGWNLMTSHDPREFADLRREFEVDWRAWCQVVYAGLSQTAPISVALTDRERDCLALFADGLRATNVAHRLGIAEVTVEKHLRSARHKLNAKTRDHAVALAVRTGLI